jgi:hypothetical protein
MVSFAGSTLASFSAVVRCASLVSPSTVLCSKTVATEDAKRTAMATKLVSLSKLGLAGDVRLD